MKPKDAKKILGCSYTTLHNYVRTNKLKAVKDPASGFLDFDEQSVLQLAQNKTPSMGNCIVVLMNGNSYMFRVSDGLLLETMRMLGGNNEKTS